MDWLRGLLPGAPAGDGPASPGRRQELQPLTEREASFADILREAQQQPVETAVLKKEGALASRALRAPQLPAVDLTANSSGQLPPEDVKLTILPAVAASPCSPLKQQQQQQAAATAVSGSPRAPAAAGLVRAAAYGITNLSSVVAIVFANKLVLYTYNFRFAVTLTWLHCIFTAVGMVAMAAVGFFEVKRVALARTLPVATVQCCTIVLNNLSIQLNTVGFYQISKIAITPVVVAIEWVCYSKPASARVLASTAVLLSGIALATATDAQVASNPLGMAIACANVVVTGLYQVWAGSKQREFGINGLQLLHQVAPLSVVLLAVVIPLLEPVGWGNPVPGTILGYTLTPAAALWIAVSSLLGLIVTLSTFLFIGATSSLTYNVVGHMKTVLIVCGGVFIFGDSMTLVKFVGLCFAMAGIIWYSQIKMSEASKSGKQ